MELHQQLSRPKTKAERDRFAIPDNDSNATDITSYNNKDYNKITLMQPAVAATRRTDMLRSKFRLMFSFFLLTGACSLAGCIESGPSPTAPPSTTTTQSTTTQPTPLVVPQTTTTTTQQTNP
jgi:hypothetical protein